jgi:TRAP-type mannitol/chloroaromatic compound transport system permease small subunit
MLIMPATLLLQGVAEILKALLVLRNPLVPPVVTDEVDVHL